MYIRIKSDNPKFSFCIQKNPNSLPKVTTIRQGVGIGWFNIKKQSKFKNLFVNPQIDSYNIRFIDAIDEVSFKDYKDQQFDYLTRGKYSSPFCAYLLIKEFLRLDESLDTHGGEIQVFGVKISQKLLELFESHYRIRYTNVFQNYNNITIKGFTLQQTVNIAIVLLFIAAIDNGEVYDDPELVRVNMDRLPLIDAPYFIRYLFKTNLIKNSPKKFEQYKNVLQQSNRYNFNFCPYNNFEARKKFIFDNVRDSDIIDIGCGEGRYHKLLQKNNSYIGIDRNIEKLANTQEKINSFEPRAKFYENIAELDAQEISGRVVLLSEVIEHNTQEDLEELVNSVKSINPSKIIVTTPNRDFNHHYFDEGLRDEDHKFEFNRDQFFTFLNKSFPSYVFSISSIGDIVNNQPTTLGAVLVTV